jgi:hypothetical protein
LPVLELFGSLYDIGANTPYDVDSDVQLVCKYLQACKIRKIDKLCCDGPIMYRIRSMADPELYPRDERTCPIIKFSTDPDLSDEECHKLLQEYMPHHLADTKITQQLFVRYEGVH